MERKIYFQGEMSGTVTSQHLEDFLSLNFFFSIKLDDLIEGLPEELIVTIFRGSSTFKMLFKRKQYAVFQVRQGDRVRIKGKIVSERFQPWLEPFFVISADHIYNETLNCGF